MRTRKNGNSDKSGAFTLVFWHFGQLAGRRTCIMQHHPLLCDAKDFRWYSERELLYEGEVGGQFSSTDYKDQDQRQKMSERNKSLQFPRLKEMTA